MTGKNAILIKRGERMKVYSPADIAKLLKVKESTLRKYSLLLEDVGYSFQKNSRKQRYYSDNDIIALRKLVTLKDSGMTLDESVKGLILWLKGDEQESKDVALYQSETDSVIKSDNSDISELKDLIYKQNELIGELSERLDKQQVYINERLNKHDDLLMRSLDESLETKKLIAATEEKQSFWSKIFRK